MYFNNDQCQIATFRDVTQLKRIAKMEAENDYLQFLNSNVSHEMITPLRCIISFTKSLMQEMTNSPK